MTKIYLGNDKYEIHFEDSTVATLTKDELAELAEFDLSQTGHNDISKEDLIKNVEYSWKQVEQYHEGLNKEIEGIIENFTTLHDLIYSRKTEKIKQDIFNIQNSITNSLQTIDDLNGSYYAEIESLNATC